MRKIVFTEAPVISVLYKDEYIVVIDKPSGLLVHRSEIDRHETLFAIQLTRDTIGQHVYPIHRLDRPTSGVLVFALSSDIARLLSEQMQNHVISKKYQAIVRGHCPEHATIDYPLKEILDKKSDKLKDKLAEPQSAITTLTRLDIAEMPFASGRYDTSRYSLVELSPITGRKHQLRRHMAHLRHPMIGDTTHGDGKQNKSASINLNLHRLALVAKSISFDHPVSHQPLTITANLDTSLKNVYQKLGWQKWYF
ncbi:tRNA pseudouridine(65) synthase TruC [Psychrosphaera sp. B3R10]|uniref:tRNA pseudouridine synthase C n=1 Tax=Psychrosphaera algicola TaxID=3023714 RepID=A0ABT5FCD0_9GAMM|nr:MULTISPECIES: tRNA pseudouridine(65) synthase TruC [unclassified Psychrosphaera]MBU2883995.1 tRNA pseudouridine(65) synthase TruC [Psychrosphaera sp. I2R16]MBU2988125.1 tRNA pseudouridine(65) synthase TruC [Psychrosphaera sp. B3R10]MDC2888231.1 tRNA pseudouridine(65) synthase TruC [Psychrosphaera sp. G1-22]MDO6721544.1 tRNA pseudouridine(65) synthase TruC [Psychrosphaera sp. 1_MG-2023]